MLSNRDVLVHSYALTFEIPLTLNGSLNWDNCKLILTV